MPEAGKTSKELSQNKTNQQNIKNAIIFPKLQNDIKFSFFEVQASIMKCYTS